MSIASCGGTETLGVFVTVSVLRLSVMLSVEIASSLLLVLMISSSQGAEYYEDIFKKIYKLVEVNVIRFVLLKILFHPESMYHFYLFYSLEKLFHLSNRLLFFRKAYRSCYQVLKILLYGDTFITNMDSCSSSPSTLK